MRAGEHAVPSSSTNTSTLADGLVRPDKLSAACLSGVAGAIPSPCSEQGDRMTSERIDTISPATLIEQWVERAGWSFTRTALALGLVLSLLLIGTAYLDGVLARPFGVDLWRRAIGHPAAVVYILLVVPHLRRLRDGAIEAFRTCCPQVFQRALVLAVRCADSQGMRREGQG